MSFILMRQRSGVTVVPLWKSRGKMLMVGTRIAITIFNPSNVWTCHRNSIFVPIHGCIDFRSWRSGTV
jgi:hypothetical protein